MRTMYGYVSDYVKSLNPNEVFPKLSPVKKLLLKLLGVVKLEEVYVKTPIGTEGATGVYLVKCLNCRELYIDYPHGYTQFLQCPKCGVRTYL